MLLKTSDAGQPLSYGDEHTQAMNQGGELTAEDKAELVEVIQRQTRGLDRDQMRWMIRAWEFMASDLRRAISPVEQQQQQMLQLEP